MNELRGLWRGKINDELDKEHNGEWIEGDLLCDKYSDGSMSYGIAKRDVFFTVRLIDPDTLGGCIGLTDKNGVKIFEGDIVKMDGIVYVIIWDNSKAMFFLQSYKPRISTDFYYIFPEDLEVIGNIHDNPELLKAERNDENGRD